jgi:hypothetical protein
MIANSVNLRQKLNKLHEQNCSFIKPDKYRQDKTSIRHFQLEKAKVYGSKLIFVTANINCDVGYTGVKKIQ